MSDINEKAVKFFKELLSSGQYDKYIERKVAKDFLIGVMDKFKELKAENKKLQESRDYALNCIKDVAMGKLIWVPKLLSDDDIKILGCIFFQVPDNIPFYWEKVLKHFTTKGEE